MASTVLVLSVISDQALSNKLNEYVALLDQARNALLAVAGFVSVGVGGLFLAGRKVFSIAKGVEDAVEPVRHEILDDEPDTLTTRVDSIVARIDEEKESRLAMHEENSVRFDRIEKQMDNLHRDVSGMRGMLDLILAKLAKLK